jgi:hypothetical protein
MDLIDKVESAIVIAFATDDIITQFATAVKSDAPILSDALLTPYLIVVSAEDRGDFPQCPGVGIKLIDVEVKISVNVGSIDQWGSRSDVLSMIAERVDDQMGAASHLPEGADVVGRFVKPGLKIFGITAEKPRRHSNTDLSRERIISREFVCAQVS